MKIDVITLAIAAHDYAIDHDGQYPESLTRLVTRDRFGWSYVEQDHVPRDPWGREYGYRRSDGPGAEAMVFTLGHDGVRGGEGEDADVDSLSLLGPHASR